MNLNNDQKVKLRFCSTPHCCCLVTKLGPTLQPQGLSSPGFPIFHLLPESAQTHIHWVGDATNHLILCHFLLLLPSIFPTIRVLSKKSAIHIRWSKYGSFSISLSNEYSGLISFKVDLFDLIAVQGLSRVFSITTIQKHQFFGSQPSIWPNSHIYTWLLEMP